MKRLIIYILLALTIYSCDSVKDVAAPQLFVANIPQNTVLMLSAAYPDAKNIIATELKKDQIWSIKLQTVEKNLQLLSDYDGDIVATDDIFGSSQVIPKEVYNFLSLNYPNAAINAITKVSKKETDIGFEVSIYDRNENKKLFFDNFGVNKNAEIDISKWQVKKILYANESLYSLENEIPSQMKDWIKTNLSGKYNLKLLYFESGERLLEYTQKGAVTQNNKIEYLFDAKHNLINSYLFVNNSQINYNQLPDLDKFPITQTQKDILQKYQFKYGIQSEKFGVENAIDMAFTDNAGYKYLVKFASKNSNPSFILSRKISENLLPLELASYLKINQLSYLNAREIFVELKNNDFSKVKTDKYIIECELNMNSSKIKKLIQFDENFKVKN
jgi:hypothetical protein